MKREENIAQIEILKKGLVYLCVFLLINISFSPLFKLIKEDSAITDTLELSSDEETPTENTKKITELLDKEFLFSRENAPINLFTIKVDDYFNLVSDLLIHHPEKDSPPPKLS